MTRAASQAFIMSGHAPAFEKMAETIAFDTATEYALLSFIEELPTVSPDPNTQWSMMSQIIGARRVLVILKEMHLKKEAVAPTKPATLRPPS